MKGKEYNESDITQAWKKLAAEKFSNSPIKKQDIMNAIKKESNTSIATLKKGLLHKIYWAVAITIGLIVGLLLTLGNADQTLMFGLAIAVYAIGTIGMYWKYTSIEDGITDDNDILNSMKANANAINSVLKIEKAWGAVTFIPAIMFGILFGSIQDGLTLAECFQDPWILKKGIIAIVVLTPLMFWVTDKMTKKAYGKDLKKLEDNIIRMETLQ